MKIIKIFILYSSLVSCAWFDSGEKKIIGDYVVGWIDISCSMSIIKDHHFQMKGQIYAVGWNEEFIIAKRHPECNQDITDYYIIDINKNSLSVKAGVFGPFNENEFIHQKTAHKVPNEIGFTLKP